MLHQYQECDGTQRGSATVTCPYQRARTMNTLGNEHIISRNKQTICVYSDQGYTYYLTLWHHCL